MKRSGSRKSKSPARMIDAGLVFSLLVTSSAWATSGVNSKETLPRVDQVTYAENLRRVRPDLWFLRADRCKDNLILKPIYREQVLRENQDFESIKRREYSLELQARDQRWADQHRKAAERNGMEIDDQLRRNGLDPADSKSSRVKEAKAQLPFFRKSYPEGNYVGYGMGRAGFTLPTSDREYLRYKVYLEFKSATDDLSPEAYLGFTKELSAAGYKGDFKLQLAPGVARFKFNNIVLHAGSKTDAYTAERVGSTFFEGKLASIGRGLDVDVDEDVQDGLDWNQFLCIGDVSRVPKEALDFVTYKD